GHVIHPGLTRRPGCRIYGRRSVSAPPQWGHELRSATRSASQKRRQRRHMMRTIAVLLGSAAIPSTPRRASSALQRGDVHGLRSLVAALGVVGDLRALRERLEAVGVDAGVVDEEVLATVVRRDEAEALVVVEPLHGSGRHVISSMAHVLCERGGSFWQRL